MNSPGLGKIVFSEEQIQERIAEIGREINRDYRDKELIVVGILKGSFYFVADLTRHLTIPLNIDFIAIGIYPEVTHKTGVIRFSKDLDFSITDRHVLLIEDVVGTGLTLAYICQHLEAARPASLKICTLLDNPAERLLTINIDYRCFTMPDVYVVGYGLDHHEQYRNLPYIAEYHRGQTIEKR